MILSILRTLGHYIVCCCVVPRSLFVCPIETNANKVLRPPSFYGGTRKKCAKIMYCAMVDSALVCDFIKRMLRSHCRHMS